MGIKTGPGGFDLDGKNYTFDVGSPGEEGISPIDPGSVPNDIDVDNEPKDLGNTTKLTLGHFLSQLTMDNQYGIDEPSNPPLDTPITTQDGVPAPTLINNHPNSEQFTKAFVDVPENGLNLPIQPPEQLRQIARARFGPNVSDPAEDLKGVFSKGKTSPQHPNGNQTLPSLIKGSSTENAIVGPYVTKVLKNNRWSDASRSTIGASNISNPSRDYNPSLHHPKYGEVSHHRLAQVGIALSIRAGRELLAATDGNNPSSAGSEAGAILPGTAQLGVTKVPLQNLKTSDVLDSLTTEEIDESQLKSITDGINDGSWGTLNNVHDQWTGITSLGMIALSISLVAAVTVIFAGLGAIIGLISPGGGPTPAKSKEGRFLLGRYTATPGTSPSAIDSLTQLPPDIASLLGVRSTVYPFGSALEIGTLTFFGIEGNTFADLASLNALDAAVTNPGWNSIVARTIIRSSTEIINSVANIGGNPVSIAKGILNIIDILRSSKLIAAINIFTTLGDQILTDDEADTITNGDTLEEPIKKSRIDKLEEEKIMMSAVQKNRLKDSLKLAWSSNRSPSSYLIPDTTYGFSIFGTSLGSHQLGAGLQDKKSKTSHYVQQNGAQTTGGARIPYDSQDDTIPTVKRMEQVLEAEYVPFYFHDLRTNEIISFHAFLTSLTDDFTPAWESTEGFGRGEPVRIYKNTQRKISLSFYAVSTSDEDFNEMWVKINKLVTLVYPQYTQGRQLIDASGENKFIQPFSQMMGASPIIRLRLGDIFRSNYSRFALARLFGADTPGAMTINNQPIDFSKSAEKMPLYQQRLLKAKTTPGGPELWRTTLSILPKYDGDGAVNVSIKPQEGTGAPAFNVNVEDSKYFLFSIVGFAAEGTTTAVVTPKIMSESEISETFGIPTKDAAGIYSRLNSIYNDSTKPAQRVIGGNFKLPSSELHPAPSTLKSISNEVFSTENQSLNALSGGDGSAFMNADKNPLVKSFRSVQGKGLAGSFDSLGFDFYDQVLWQTETYGSKAPQFLKVNISFTPIHDIAPGLDHQGYNRAPIYPVGWFNHSNDSDKSNK